ncbi:MAG: TRAP transporter TatT component family protein [Verrucomicrobiae bacterium]|nr:TRAP transporter TatT component family protein [Verrucomicrobiae bacterium]
MKDEPTEFVTWRTFCGVRILVAGLLLVGFATGCSIKRVAVNHLGNVLASGGTTFTSDDDPELVRAAIPFSLKLMEGLLAESPGHKELLRATCSGFVQYAYAFVQQDADELEDRDLAAATELRARAKKLYLRARDYGLRGLEVGRPGFRRNFYSNPHAALQRMKRSDVPLLYWTGASWGAAIALAKDDPQLLGETPLMEALIYRALELDEAFGKGAIHTFLITYEMSRRADGSNPAERARAHFDRAIELSEGSLAAPLVAYAEAVCVQQQDVRTFRKLLEQALALDVNARPQHRLENLLFQRRARWLLSKEADLFLMPEKQGQKNANDN